MANKPVGHSKTKYKGLYPVIEKEVKRLNKQTNGTYPGLKRHANYPGAKMQYNNAYVLCEELEISVGTILKLESDIA